MIAVKTAYTYTYYTRIFVMLKGRKRLYTNFTLAEAFKSKKIHRTLRSCGVSKERCMMKRYV